MGSLDESELPARRLARIERVLVAGPRYIAAHGAPRSLADLRDHAALVSDPRRATWSFEAAPGPTELRVRWRIATGGMPALVEAARLDLGIALLPRYMVEAQLVAGELVRVDAGAAPTTTYATALLPGARMASAAVRQLLDFIAAALARDPIFATRPARR
jgi:DNA-binding transcriptional LysR family regulator